MSAPSPPSIGVLVCSQRKPRVCPKVTDFVLETIMATFEDAQTPPANLHIIDLAEWNLPLFDEDVLPQMVVDTSGYTHAHTRAWSEEIKKHQGFIFVTPQYNWGYPASVKNAIDYLFNEWKGKSAMIVSYGGHGGGKSAGQLRQVLGSIHMTVAETMPALAFPSKAAVLAAAKGEMMPLAGESSIWQSERPSVSQAFEELMSQLRSQ